MEPEVIYNMILDLEGLISPESPNFEAIDDKIEEIKQKLQE